MKRLVVCCDGTWQTETDPWHSNVAKLAQLISARGRGPDGNTITQRVTYLSGPGSRGFFADRVVGGALGLGVEANLSSAYWHLALNWEPGDEIFLFGFSRGAFTIRLLTGMIDRLGLMRPEAMISGHYSEAMRINQLATAARRPGPHPPPWADFRQHHSAYPVPINFVGLFDTVGAYGLSGVLRSFSLNGIRNTQIPDNVLCGRHALAIDDRRRQFSPIFWESEGVRLTKYPYSRDRIRQVWFRGVHRDIGGGYRECGMSDLSLKWMMRQAREVGLEFDAQLVDALDAQCRTRENHDHRHESSNWLYSSINVVRLLRQARSRLFYWDSRRRLDHGHDYPGMRIAASALAADLDESPNLLRLIAEHGGTLPEAMIEPLA